MKLRHDFAGHYNRADIFQLHINRSAPHIYTVHEAEGSADKESAVPTESHPHEAEGSEVEASAQVAQIASIRAGESKS